MTPHGTAIRARGSAHTNDSLCSEGESHPFVKLVTSVAQPIAKIAQKDHACPNLRMSRKAYCESPMPPATRFVPILRPLSPPSHARVSQFTSEPEGAIGTILLPAPLTRPIRHTRFDAVLYSTTKLLSPHTISPNNVYSGIPPKC